MRSFNEDIVPVIFFVFLTRVTCNELFLNSLLISVNLFILVPGTKIKIST